MITFAKIFTSIIIRVLVEFKLELPEWTHLQEMENARYEYSEGFSDDWYKVVGVSICYSLIFESILLYLVRIAGPFYHLFQRCRDRGCSRHLRANKTDKIRTKKGKQREVKDLYTG